MSKIGRPSKIERFGIGAKLDKLYSQGYSIKEVYEIIKEEYPDISNSISYSTIQRYLTNQGKYNTKNKPIKLIDDFKSMITDIEFKLDMLDSITGKHRKAIKSFIRKQQNAFVSKLKHDYLGISDTSNSDYERINQELIEFSELLCFDCRRKVLRMIEKEARNRKQLRNIR